ncbi:hypothetical protein DL93DRAFT_1000414 [Clavulina sp. PMI_390]|nr:hypothetical protein DL93DRAFT_1000414 [Clavulina sp. PMI_390]
MSALDQSIHQLKVALDLLETLTPKPSSPKQCYVVIHPASARAAYLNTVQAERQVCEDRVQSVREIQSRLNAVTDRLADELHHLAESVSPIYGLPNEILRMVFVWATNNGTIPSAKKAAKLAKVCRHWRNVAYAQNQLWTKVSTTLPRIHSIASLLPRSVGLPLSLKISEPRVLRTPPKLALDLIKRLRHLQIEHPREISPSINQLCGSSDRESRRTFHTLEHLEITFGGQDHSGRNDLRLFSFPALVRLEIEGGVISRIFAPNLRQLRISPIHIEYRTFPGLLRDLPSLEELIVDHAQTTSEMLQDFRGVPSVELNHLRCLEIWSSDRETFVAIFSVVVAPNLEVLRLDGVFPSFRDADVALPDTPVDLSLHNGAIVDVGIDITLEIFSMLHCSFRRFLSRSPSITELEISAPPFTLGCLTLILQPVPALLHPLMIRQLNTLTLTLSWFDFQTGPVPSRLLGQNIASCLVARAKYAGKINTLTLTACLAQGTDISDLAAHVHWQDCACEEHLENP